MARLHGEARPAASEVRGNDAIAARLRVSEGRRQGPLVFPPARRRCFLGDLGALSLGQAHRSGFTPFSAKLSWAPLTFQRALPSHPPCRHLPPPYNLHSPHPAHRL